MIGQIPAFAGMTERPGATVCVIEMLTYFNMQIPERLGLTVQRHSREGGNPCVSKKIAQVRLSLNRNAWA